MSRSIGKRRRRITLEVREGYVERKDRNATKLARFVSHNAIAITAFLAGVHLVLALLTFLPQPHTGGDNAAYITLGRSLLERGQLLSLYDPATPLHTQYPPVFPAILALAMAIGLQPWVQLKILMAIFSAGAVAISFLWMSRRRRPLIALGAGGVLALSPGVLEQGHWILSDVPFWFFTMLAVWSFERIRPDNRSRFAVAVIAVVLAYFTRSAGLPLLIAAFGWLLLGRQWKRLAILAMATLPFALWWYLRARSQGGVDYVSQFWFVNPYAPELGRIGAIDLFDRIIENGSKYIRIHMPILLTGTQGFVPLALSVSTFALGIFGWVRRLRRPALAELFLGLYIALILVWPAVWSGERFLLPALPLLLFYAADGLTRVAHRIRRGSGLTAGAAAAAVLVLAMAPTEVRAIRFSGACMFSYRTGERYPCMIPPWRDFFEIGEWAGSALPDGAPVLSRKPRLFYVISGGHPGRTYPLSPDPAELIRSADEIGARHIVFDHLDRLSQAYLAPAVLGRITAFCAMHESQRDRTLVLGILPGAAQMQNSTDDQAAGVSLPVCDREYWRPGTAPDALSR